MTIGEFLKEILPTINAIDGGCWVCVGSFVDRVNRVLDKFQVPYRYCLGEEADEAILVAMEVDPEKFIPKWDEPPWWAK